MDGPPVGGGSPGARTVSWSTSDGEADRAGRLRTYDAEHGGAGTAVTVGAEPVALVGVGDAVWTIGATGVLTKVDPAAGTVLAEVDLGGATVDAVVAGGELWVGDIGRSLVHVLDPESGEVVADPIVVEAGAVRLAPAGDRLWVSGLEDQVTPVDVRRPSSPGEPVTVGRAPIGMAMRGRRALGREQRRRHGQPHQPGERPAARRAARCRRRTDRARGRRRGRRGSWTRTTDRSTASTPRRASRSARRSRCRCAPAACRRDPAGVWVVGVDPSRVVAWRVNRFRRRRPSG